MLKSVIVLASAATALAPHALTRGPSKARRRPTCASSTIDDLARGKVVTGDGTKRPPVFTVEQLRRLARTRETIERRFEAPAVERPAEAQPKDQPKDEAAPLSNEELAAWFDAVDEHFITQLAGKSEELLKKKMSVEEVRAIYKPTVTRKDDFPPGLKCKYNSAGSKAVRCWTEEGAPVELDDHITAIAHTRSVTKSLMGNSRYM